MKPKILLVNDQDGMLDGLRPLLGDQQHFHIVGIAADSVDAVYAAIELQPDIVLLNIGMLSTNKLLAAEQIINCAQGVRVIIITRKGPPAQVLQALQAGVHGCVLEATMAAELSKAVDIVMAGHHYFSPDLTDMIIEEYVVQPMTKQAAARALTLLNELEWEILTCIAERRSSANIAELLGLAPHTVDLHRNRIMRKLEISSSAGLAAFAIRQGLTKRKA